MNPPEKILSLDEIIRTKRETGHLKNQLDILELKQTDLANLKLLISTRIGEHKTFQNFFCQVEIFKNFQKFYVYYFTLNLKVWLQKRPKKQLNIKQLGTD